MNLEKDFLTYFHNGAGITQLVWQLAIGWMAEESEFKSQ
jgi:hypothetical protein